MVSFKPGVLPADYMYYMLNGALTTLSMYYAPLDVINFFVENDRFINSENIHNSSYGDWMTSLHVLFLC